MSLLKYNFYKIPKNDLPTHKVPTSKEQTATSTIKSNIDLSTSSTISVTKSTDYIDNNSYPDCWDSKQIHYFTETYPWMYFKEKKIGCTFCRDVNLNLLKQTGSHIATEWSNAEISPTGLNLKNKQTNLRKKISKHKLSISHLNAQKIVDESKKKKMDEKLSEMVLSESNQTQKIFRTAYLISKNQRPYTDMPKLVDLQVINGVDLGRILQTNVSCIQIIDHIAFEMRKKLAKCITENETKLCILVDESTTLSKKSMLVVCLRCAIGELGEINTFFFDIVELNNTSAISVKGSMLQALEKYGINFEFLKKNLIAFVSDGASNMLGRKSGVGTLLKNDFPNIITWHCCNHRLELAVNDTLKEVSGLNHFQSFIEKLYATYHMSPKNTSELRECAASLEKQLLTIGKIFTIRWVASSQSTVKAVWNNYEALFKHFSYASTDTCRDSRERAKYNGLKNILTSNNFVHNLGVLYDALIELSDLSIQLQKRDMTLPAAYKSVQRTIRVLESMASIPGPKSQEVISACENKEFKNIQIYSKTSVIKVQMGQFFTSLSNNIKQRLMTTQASNVSSREVNNEYQVNFKNLIEDLEVLSPENWPDNMDIQYGDESIRRLSQVFQIDQVLSVRGFREYKENKKVNIDIKPLMTVINSIAISSSECERTFSSMNVIVSPIRSTLTSNHLSSLIFIHCVGPPLEKFDPKSFVKSWIMRGKRSATETNCLKRAKKDENESNPYNSIWNCLNV